MTGETANVKKRKKKNIATHFAVRTTTHLSFLL